MTCFGAVTQQNEQLNLDLAEVCNRELTVCMIVVKTWQYVVKLI